MLLKNATALITGGAQGLGKGFARAVLQRGGKVSLLDVQTDLGTSTENEFNKEFGTGSAMFIKCDVRQKEELTDAFKNTKATFRTLDLVVNNAGVSTIGDDWERTIDINLTAVMRGCLLAVEYLSKGKEGQGGHIINIASVAGLKETAFDPAYAASKHGVVGLTRSLALILKPQSIRVNCLCPWFTDTNIVRSAMDHTRGEANKTAFLKLIQSHGLLTISEVTDAFTKLLEAEDETGAVMAVTIKGCEYKHKGLKLSQLK